MKKKNIDTIPNWILRLNTDVNLEGVYAYENESSRNWRFMHRFNPKIIEVVIQRFDKEEIKGKSELISYLDKIGEFKKSRLYNKQYKKDKYEMIERLQSYKKPKEDKF